MLDYCNKHCHAKEILLKMEICCMKKRRCCSKTRCFVLMISLILSFGLFGFNFVSCSTSSGDGEDNYEEEKTTKKIDYIGSRDFQLISSTKQITDELYVTLNFPSNPARFDSVLYAKDEQAKLSSYFYKHRTIPTGNGIKIIANENNEYSFKVTENGYYTVCVHYIDRDYYDEKGTLHHYKGGPDRQIIYIRNINKVDDLYATYSASQKRMTLTWKSYGDKISSYILSCSVENNGETKNLLENESITETSYTIENIELSSGTYIFKVTPIFTTGDFGKEKSISVVPSSEPEISKIKLDNYYVVSEESINVTLIGSNFDLIEDGQTIQVQVINKNGTIESTADANIIDGNCIKATVKAPCSASENGTNYIVRANFLGNIDTEHISTVNVSKGAEITGFSLTPSKINLKDVNDNSLAKVTISGSKLGTAKNISLQMYDSSGNKYGEEISIDLTDYERNANYIYAEIPIPKVNDKFFVRPILESNELKFSETIWIFGSLEFTEFKIPKAGITAAGKTVEATVIGKNFSVDGITASSFEIICDTTSDVTASDVNIIADTLLTFKLKIPSKVGNYTVKFTDGNSIIENSLDVKDYSAYVVGDIIFADGTLIPSAKIDSYTENSSNPAVAVIGGFNSNGAAIGVGLKQGSYLPWALDETTGYTTNFTDIASNYSYSSSEGKYVYIGDTDGSNNWEIVSAIDPLGANNASRWNYAAFKFVATYADNRSYSGDIATGWYLPSASELKTVLENYSTINASMNKVRGTEIDSSTSYWSSSQTESSDLAYCCYKYSSSKKKKSSNWHVLVVRQF